MSAPLPCNAAARMPRYRPSARRSPTLDRGRRRRGSRRSRLSSHWARSIAMTASVPHACTSDRRSNSALSSSIARCAARVASSSFCADNNVLASSRARAPPLVCRRRSSTHRRRDGSALRLDEATPQPAHLAELCERSAAQCESAARPAARSRWRSASSSSPTKRCCRAMASPSCAATTSARQSARTARKVSRLRRRLVEPKSAGRRAVDAVDERRRQTSAGARSWSSRAHCCRAKARRSDAARRQRAIDELSALFDRRSLVHAWGTLAVIAIDRAQWDEAESAATRAVDAAVKVGERRAEGLVPRHARGPRCMAEARSSMRANITRTRRARCSTSATTARARLSRLARGGASRARRHQRRIAVVRDGRIGDWRRPIDRCSSSPWACCAAMFELSRAGDSGTQRSARDAVRAATDSASIRAARSSRARKCASRFASRARLSGEPVCPAVEVPTTPHSARPHPRLLIKLWFGCTRARRVDYSRTNFDSRRGAWKVMQRRYGAIEPRQSRAGMQNPMSTATNRSDVQHALPIEDVAVREARRAHGHALIERVLQPVEQMSPRRAVDPAAPARESERRRRRRRPIRRRGPRRPCIRRRRNRRRSRRLRSRRRQSRHP